MTDLAIARPREHELSLNSFCLLASREEPAACLSRSLGKGWLERLCRPVGVKATSKVCVAALQGCWLVGYEDRLIAAGGCNDSSGPPVVRPPVHVFPGAGARSQKSNRGKESVFKPPVSASALNFATTPLQQIPKSPWTPTQTSRREQKNKKQSWPFPTRSEKKSRGAAGLAACWLPLQSFSRSIYFCGLVPGNRLTASWVVLDPSFFFREKKGTG